MESGTDFLKIGITLPGEWKENPSHGNAIEAEAARISDFLLNEGIDIFHIRKPDWTKDKIRLLISNISPALHPRLRLHDPFSHLKEFSLGGVQIN